MKRSIDGLSVKLHSIWRPWGMCAFLVVALLIQFGQAAAFQIAPLGSTFEARLTNEPESTLAKVAARVGVLLKSPVHEEITQLGFGCPTDREKLVEDASCSGRDLPFANPYIIYGVRWNDLPPFQLSPSQGQGCRKLLGGKACNVKETVRFSTQPECWYCMFKQAERRAATRKITGCTVGRGYIRGNLMTRSHFGDLQFLHAMAEEEGVPAAVTRQLILQWLELAWRVVDGDIQPSTMLKDVPLPWMQERFSCSDWTVADIYILGRNDKLGRRIPDIAFGSVLHTVQDSFAAAHGTRERPVSQEKCSDSTPLPRPGRIVEFHTYGAQDGHKHDLQDAREAMATNARDLWPEAVEATRNLFDLYYRNAKWTDAKPYIECLLELGSSNRPSSPGNPFRRATQ